MTRKGTTTARVKISPVRGLVSAKGGGLAGCEGGRGRAHSRVGGLRILVSKMGEEEGVTGAFWGLVWCFSSLGGMLAVRFQLSFRGASLFWGECWMCLPADEDRLPWE